MKMKDGASTGRFSCVPMRFCFAAVIAGVTVVSEAPDRDEWHRQRGTSVIRGNTLEHRTNAELLARITSRTVIAFGDGSHAVA